LEEPYEIRPQGDSEHNHEPAQEGLGDLDSAGKNVSSRTGKVDRSGTRTVAFGLSPDLAHQGMVDPTGDTVKGYFLSHFLGGGLRPIDEERHDLLLNRPPVLAGEFDTGDPRVTVGGGGNRHLGSDFRILHYPPWATASNNAVVRLFGTPFFRPEPIRFPPLTGFPFDKD